MHALVYQLHFNKGVKIIMGLKRIYHYNACLGKVKSIYRDGWEEICNDRKREYGIMVKSSRFPFSQLSHLLKSHDSNTSPTKVPL